MWKISTKKLLCSVSFMLSVANKSIMLSVIILSVVRLNVVMLNVVAPLTRHPCPWTYRLELQFLYVVKLIIWSVDIGIWLVNLHILSVFSIKVPSIRVKCYKGTHSNGRLQPCFQKLGYDGRN